MIHFSSLYTGSIKFSKLGKKMWIKFPRDTHHFSMLHYTRRRVMRQDSPQSSVNGIDILDQISEFFFLKHQVLKSEIKASGLNQRTLGLNKTFPHRSHPSHQHSLGHHRRTALGEHIHLHGDTAWYQMDIVGQWCSSSHSWEGNLAHSGMFFHQETLSTADCSHHFHWSTN